MSARNIENFIMFFQPEIMHVTDEPQFITTKPIDNRSENVLMVTGQVMTDSLTERTLWTGIQKNMKRT
jgi:hypothetical protein